MHHNTPNPTWPPSLIRVCGIKLFPILYLPQMFFIIQILLLKFPTKVLTLKISHSNFKAKISLLNIYLSILTFTLYHVNNTLSKAFSAKKFLFLTGLFWEKKGVWLICTTRTFVWIPLFTLTSCTTTQEGTAVLLIFWRSVKIEQKRLVNLGFNIIFVWIDLD